MALASQKDFVSGLMFMTVGGSFAWGAVDYELGDAARMGPGYFPFWLGVCLSLLGAVVTLGSMSAKAENTEVEKFNWKVLFVIIGAVVLCGLTLNSLGVYISIFLLVPFYCYS